MARLAAHAPSGSASGDVVVELNYLFPFAVLRIEKEAQAALMGPVMREVCRQLRRALSHDVGWTHHNGEGLKVGVIDSGCSAPILTRRIESQYDFSDLGDVRRVPSNESSDALGHGTLVCRILDEILPDKVKLVVAKIGNQNKDVTLLRLARCYAGLLAREQPDVINLSLAPFDDEFECPNCGNRIKCPFFVSGILGYLFGMAQSTGTFSVVAAGNAGQACTQRLAVDPKFVLFAEALNSRGQMASYSNSIGPGLLTAAAFGGDSPNEGRGELAFRTPGGHFGTSFAAPVVSSVLLAFKSRGVADPLELVAAQTRSFLSFLESTILQ